MKTLISASILAIGLFAGTANAAKVFDDINATAPRSTVFEDINATAPRTSVFQDLQNSAPRSDGVFGDLETRAP
jgi:hypothetical protein